MSTLPTVDAGRLGLLLNELRLPTIKLLWPQFAERADKEGWPAAYFLATIAEHELAERGRRRIERHLADARLLPGKTLDNFDFEAVPMISKAQVMALCAGDGWLEQGANLILFGPPGGGKTHLAAAIGLALVENGWRVLFTRTTDLVQKLQVARRELQIESAIAKLDKGEGPSSSGALVLAVAELPGIVVDDTQARKVGLWQDSQFSKRYIGDGYAHDQDGGKGAKTLTFIHQCPEQTLL